MNEKALLLIFVLMFVIALAACGSKDDKKAAEETPAATKAPTEEAAPEPVVNKEPVTIRVDVPSIPIEIRPGDLLVFNNYMKHASFGGGNNRRVLLINFSRHYTEEHMEELKQYVSTFSNYWVEELHGEAVLKNASPERMRHLRQIQENQAHLPELARKAKEAAQKK